jgi:hypothetical protein
MPRGAFLASLLLLWLSILPCVSASDASSPGPHAESTPSAPLPAKPQVSQCQPDEVRDNDRITVEGCLTKGNEEFSFSSYSGKSYDLVGDHSLLNKHATWMPGKNVCVQGTVSSDDSAINVTSIRNLPKRVARLNPPFGPPSQWRERTNKPYGLSFRLPESFPTSENDQYVEPNFPVESGAVNLGVFAIEGHLLVSPPVPECDKGTDSYDGGRFVIFVNPLVTNQGACNQFGESDPESHAWRTFHGMKFSKTSGGGGGMGQYYSYDYYHTFQNGRCYEFVFSDHSSAVNPDDPCACAYPEVPGTDRLVQTTLSQLSFPKTQSPAVVSSKAKTEPEIVSFTASSTTADDAKNRGSIKFSWSTRNTDFVRLSYSCTGGEEIPQKGMPNLGLDGIVILEEGAIGKGCGGKYDTPQIVNHSANTSLGIGFGNSEFDTPVLVRVTLTPYSHGVGYSNSSRTIPISVNPMSQFSDGLPTPTGNITFESPSSAKGVPSYHQGASSKIEWADNREGDEHFWLHLVRDNGSGGMKYLYQIAGYVPRTGDSTSYAWVVPKSYSGSGFRIFVNSQGRVGNQSSYGISAPFEIIPR